MTHMRTKLIVAGLAITVAVSILAVAGVREGWVYYLPVDQFVSGASYHDQRVRLHGMVSAENLDVSTGLLVARFDLLGETERIRIEYSGVVPDMFEAEREVVIEGTLDEAGVFQADTLLTKCASKYESDGEAPHPESQSKDVRE
ncbi:MAG: cytochrome c maturation protein CcmE [Planctomycetes bacterium]|nr:cytochrome c maturation protein CcmE [Planctomycetota bacterium]